MAARAQQMPLYSQYVMNSYMLNPAVTGSDGYTSFNITARQQWIGFKDAPANYSVSGQTRLLKRSYVIKRRNINKASLKPSTKGRVGLGGFIYNDRNGAVERTGLQGSYAYHIFMKETQFSFGLSVGIFQFRVHEHELSLLDEGDPIAGSLKRVIYVPDANLGFQIMSPRYYAGISVNQVFQSYLRIGNQAFEEYKMERHFFLLAGYKFDLGNNYHIEPSFLVKTTDKLVMQADMGAKFYFMEDYWAGASVRTSGDLILTAGVRVKMMYLGYAFDYSLSRIRKFSYGSHEVVLAVKLGDNARRYRWLNRY
jgi:type IX secretion system PorP/SprF family membrane protein